MMHWLRDHMEREDRWSYSAVPTYNGLPMSAWGAALADLDRAQKLMSVQTVNVHLPKGDARLCAELDHSRSDWAESGRFRKLSRS